MGTLSVLLTNNALAARGGSETYLRDVALALLRRGHRPVAFSMVHGEVADELRRATIPVVDDLARVGQAPDVIHGHHHLETLMAALAFPNVPIVHFCHGWIPWEEKPLRHPSIRRYVAVDDVCVDRLVREEGIDAARVERLLNFVDLTRFRSRHALPGRPARALVFSNHSASPYTRHIREACAAHHIAVDLIGAESGNATAAPEALLPAYDLVFAKARAALEAMAVGCAVVLADWMGCGPLVTSDNFDALRPLNFGVRMLQQPHDTAWYADQIAAYRREAVAAVSARVRAEAGLEAAADRLVQLYEDAIATPGSSDGASRAAAQHLQIVARPLKEAWDLRSRVPMLDQHVAILCSERDGAVEGRAVLETRVQALQARVETLETESASLRDAVASADRARSAAQEALARERAARDETREVALARMAALDATLADYRGLTTLRVRDAILRVPLLGAAARQAARLVPRPRKT